MFLRVRKRVSFNVLALPVSLSSYIMIYDVSVLATGFYNKTTVLTFGSRDRGRTGRVKVSKLDGNVWI